MPIQIQPATRPLIISLKTISLLIVFKCKSICQIFVCWQATEQNSNVKISSPSGYCNIITMECNSRAHIHEYCMGFGVSVGSLLYTSILAFISKRNGS